MTTSMTAFARIEQDQPFGRITWEIRSVNHRYLDVHLKLPDDLKALETPVRELVGRTLQRGRVDVLLRFEGAPRGRDAVNIDSDALESFAAVVDQLKQRLPDLQPARVDEALKWPGVLPEPGLDSDVVAEQAMTLLQEALDSLLSHRRREGERMGAVILERLQQCRQLVADLKQDWPRIEQAMREKWQKRVDDVISDADPARIHQELALLLTRADVGEEVDRLQTHFDEVEKVLGENKPVGRRLDFLMQELNREANTLGSKSVDASTTGASVELKVLIEQMREQVQNIE